MTGLAGSMSRTRGRFREAARRDRQPQAWGRSGICRRHKPGSAGKQAGGENGRDASVVKSRSRGCESGSGGADGVGGELPGEMASGWRAFGCCLRTNGECACGFRDMK